jgi:hypothetical protein
MRFIAVEGSSRKVFSVEEARPTGARELKNGVFRTCAEGVVYTSLIWNTAFAAESKALICPIPKPQPSSRAITIGSILACPHNARLMIIGLSQDLATALTMHNL